MQFCTRVDFLRQKEAFHEKRASGEKLKIIFLCLHSSANLTRGQIDVGEELMKRQTRVRQLTYGSTLVWRREEESSAPTLRGATESWAPVAAEGSDRPVAG